MRTNIGVSIPNFHDISEIERSLASLPKIRFLLLRFSAVCQTAESNCPDQVQRQQDLQDRHFGFQKEPLCSMVDCTEKTWGSEFSIVLTNCGVSLQPSVTISRAFLPRFNICVSSRQNIIVRRGFLRKIFLV